jgi:hypothetical protein
LIWVNTKQLVCTDSALTKQQILAVHRYCDRGGQSWVQTEKAQVKNTAERVL